MKNKALIIAIAAMALLLNLTQCKKPSTFIPEAPVFGNVSISFNTGYTGGKADIDYFGKVTWNQGDKVYVVYKGEAQNGTLIAQSEGEKVAIKGTVEGSMPQPSEEIKKITLDLYYIGKGVDFEWPTTGHFSGDIVMKIENQRRSGIAESDAAEYGIGHVRAEFVPDDAGTGWTYKGILGFKLLTATIRLNTSFKCSASASGEHIYNTLTLHVGGDVPTWSCSKTGENNIRFFGSTDVLVELLPSSDTGEYTDEVMNVLWEDEETTGEFTIKGGIESNTMYCKIIDEYPTPYYVDNSRWICFNDEAMEIADVPIWSKYNVGVDLTKIGHFTSPTDWYGGYYAWGEIAPYYAKGHAYDLTCENWDTEMITGAGNHVNPEGYVWASYSQGGSGSFAEWLAPPYDLSTRVLKDDRDVAKALWGDGWRMPLGGSDGGEWKELRENSYFVWYDGENGGIYPTAGYIVYRVKRQENKGCMTDVYGDTYDSEGEIVETPQDYSLSDPHMFLALAGYRAGKGLVENGNLGKYWSKTYFQNSRAYFINFESEEIEYDRYHRYYGYSVRPVREVPGQ